MGRLERTYQFCGDSEDPYGYHETSYAFKVQKHYKRFHDLYIPVWIFNNCIWLGRETGDLDINEVRNEKANIDTYK